MDINNITVFELLGIENKELPVSNLLSYYLNPNINKDLGYLFLNEFCMIANIKPVLDDEVVFVDREFFIHYNGESNYIDILIRIGSKDNPSRIICIENKINSSEGLQQTKRYYHALDSKFPECNNRQYIYLTKNNSSVDLSSQHFIHIRYSELGELLANINFDRLPLANDFYKYYVLKEKELFQDIEKNDSEMIFGDVVDFKNLIDYIVWKFNCIQLFQDNGDFFCMFGKSAQSNIYFYQLSMQNWEFELDGKPMSIHLEGYSNEVYLHMEIKPYVPYNSIEKSYGNEFFNKYVHQRDELRSITFEKVENSIIVPIRRNANLQIAKFDIKAITYKSYYDTLRRLVLYVNDVLVKSGILECK